MPIIDQVVEILQTQIQNGVFAEDQKLPSEQSLCESLHVGRSTLREAFRVLQTIGYVELRPGRGAFVKSSAPLDIVRVRDWFKENAPLMKDFIEVREAIESLAMRLAFEKGTEEEFVEVKKINDLFIEAFRRSDVNDLARLDEEFHGAFIRMSHNSLLININNLVAKEFKKYRSISFAVEANAASAAAAHERIVDAILRGDRIAAVESVAAHLRSAVADMETVIKE
jgi:GntR family transcriptional regulator, transcriptional repressor for pyruvate dehydrogenase complex